MIRSMRTYGYLFGYLPFSLKKLKQVQALPESTSIQEKDAFVDEEPIHWASGILKRTKSTFHVEGIENLIDGPALLISNHEGNFDIPTLIANIPKPFGFISKAEVKKLPVIRDWMEEMNCIFLDRTDRRSAMQVLKDAATKLQEGHSIIIFPEGTRSKGAGVQEFKSGFAKVAQDANVPIIPIALSGTSDIMEKNKNWIKPAHVRISILPHIEAEDVMAMSRKQLTEHAEQIIKEEVQRLQQQK
ncbi:MAG TPA: lysophospholipid acyltransferase family protein [Savagea sp.]